MQEKNFKRQYWGVEGNISTSGLGEVFPQDQPVFKQAHVMLTILMLKDTVSVVMETRRKVQGEVKEKSQATEKL